MKLDREKISKMVLHQMDNQRSENGLITNYAKQIQPSLDKMNIDAETKSAFLDIVMHTMSATAQFSAQITAEIIESIQNQENQNS